ncbi:MAG TPA: hypothetical protein VHG71_00275 [Verrucomicrobiae bacterium]|nr:hypothetical protein [Verrucomicrobiae bacterium]
MKKIILGIFTSCLALAIHAQSVLEAPIGIQSTDGDGELLIGKIWFQIENGEAEFQAYVTPVGDFTSSLSPVLSIPGSSLQFSLGDGSYQTISTFGNYNPFLATPLQPTSYDCDGNPVYAYAPVILSGNFYSGEFSLSPDFLNELLAGNGKIELNSSIGGNIIVDAVPEPSTLALAIVAGGCLFLIWWLKSSSRRRCP